MPNTQCQQQQALLHFEYYSCGKYCSQEDEKSSQNTKDRKITKI
jgi:hypothetical protein